MLDTLTIKQKKALALVGLSILGISYGGRITTNEPDIYALFVDFFYVDSQEEIFPILQDIINAEMMCLVSTREGMSNAMIEAMSLGLPCICTKVSGAIDLIENEKNGILIDIDDEEALFNQMNRIVDNKLFANNLGFRASQLYGKLRTDIISKKWIELIDSLVQN